MINHNDYIDRKSMLAAELKERCRNLSFAIAVSQDGGAIRDMRQRLSEAQDEMYRIDSMES